MGSEAAGEGQGAHSPGDGWMWLGWGGSGHDVRGGQIPDGF